VTALEAPENAAYWRAADEGHLLIKRCNDCGRPHYYPRARCPFCASPNTEWREASGAGTVYSFTIVRRAKPPYVAAYVTLAEGISMLTHVVDCDFEAVHIGQKVRLLFRRASDGRNIPMFTPDSPDTGS
jgi:uncharacterized protein